MFKKLLFACALGSAAMLAHAAPAPYITYEFAYTGFFDDVNGGAWNPDMRLEGSFVAQDRNANGKIETSEAGAPIFDGMRFNNCGSGNPYTRCRLDALTFTPGVEFKLKAFTQYFYPNETFYSSINTGVEFEYYMENPGGMYHTKVRWSPETQFNITPSTIAAVPEPSTYAMLLAGIAGLALIQRRRKQQA